MNGYKNLNGVLEEYAKYVIQQAKTNLTKDVNKYGKNKGGGNLYNSLSYDILVNNEDFLVDFLMEDYGQFVAVITSSGLVHIHPKNAKVIQKL